MFSVSPFQRLTRHGAMLKGFLVTSVGQFGPAGQPLVIITQGTCNTMLTDTPLCQFCGSSLSCVSDLPIRKPKDANTNLEKRTGGDILYV